MVPVAIPLLIPLVMKLLHSVAIGGEALQDANKRAGADKNLVTYKGMWDKN